MAEAPAQTQARILPRNIEAEEAVVGGILFSGRSLAQVQDLLAAEDFYHPALHAIYEAMLELDSQAKPIDIITVAEQMRTGGTLAKLKAYGDEGYLVELSTKIATIENITHHARIVREKSQVRRAIVVSTNTARKGYQGPADVAAYLEEAQQEIGTVCLGSGEDTVRPVRQVTHAALKGLEQRFHYKQAITGIPTGYHQLDEMTGGLQPSHLVILAARPKVGKSALLGELVLHAACPQTRENSPAYQEAPVHPVLVFTAEMSAIQVVERNLCSEARVDSHRMRTGYLETRDWIQLTKAAGILSGAPIWMDERTRTLAGVRAKTRRWLQDIGPAAKREGWGAPLVAIDYLQLLSNPGAAGKNGNREQEIASISRGLKILAKELHICIVALAQINRGVEQRKDKRPAVSDLRESGSIEADADLICLLYRDEMYEPESPDKGIAELIIGAQRGGATGTVYLKFIAEYTRFESSAHQPQPRPAAAPSRKSWHDRGQDA